LECVTGSGDPFYSIEPHDPNFPSERAVVRALGSALG
jgi:hypothetical protein